MTWADFSSGQWERGQHGRSLAWRQGVHGKLTWVGERNGEQLWQPLKDTHFAQIMLGVYDCNFFLLNK